MNNKWVDNGGKILMVELDSALGSCVCIGTYVGICAGVK